MKEKNLFAIYGHKTLGHFALFRIQEMSRKPRELSPSPRVTAQICHRPIPLWSKNTSMATLDLTSHGLGYGNAEGEEDDDDYLVKSLE